MNLTEIKKGYLEKITKMCLEYSNKIDKILIIKYKFIMEHKRIEFQEGDIKYNYLAESYKKDVLKAIQQHYIKNWDIVYYEDLVSNKEKGGLFIFTYKEDHQEIKAKKSQTNRYNILDI